MIYMAPIREIHLIKEVHAMIHRVLDFHTGKNVEFNISKSQVSFDTGKAILVYSRYYNFTSGILHQCESVTELNNFSPARTIIGLTDGKIAKGNTNLVFVYNKKRVRLVKEFTELVKVIEWLFDEINQKYHLVSNSKLVVPSHLKFNEGSL